MAILVLLSYWRLSYKKAILKSIQIAIFNSKIRSVRGFELQSYRLSQIAGIPMALLVKLLFLLIDMTWATHDIKISLNNRILSKIVKINSNCYITAQKFVKERKSIFPDKIYKLNWVPVGLKECGHIRKLLNRNHLGYLVSSKTEKCWKMKGPQNMSNWYFKLFEVSFALSIVKIQKLIFSALQD